MCIKLKKISVLMVLLLFFSSSAGLANAVWVSGKVTRKPHEINNSCYIQVDGDLYRILFDIPIYYRYERSPGAFNERKAYLSSICIHQKIMIKVRKNQIIQIILY